ncbi:MAG: 23S rRNA (pseudouridine(1915)-N(3))-methyltransferase RlmH [Pseudomonadota bacterium]
MRLCVIAVGRLRDSPEARLAAAYADRAGAVGRPLALGPVRIEEIDERTAADPVSQTARILRAAQDRYLIALDERGRRLDSPAFAQLLADLRDRGLREVAFAIGGADGHAPAMAEAAAERLSFGAMVWPHALARAMLCEQLYRAASILAGAPYHRR